MNDPSKTKGNKCPYCTPKDPENPCVLAGAKTVIDGKEYTACCSNPIKTETKPKEQRRNLKSKPKLTKSV